MTHDEAAEVVQNDDALNAAVEHSDEDAATDEEAREDDAPTTSGPR